MVAADSSAPPVLQPASNGSAIGSADSAAAFVPLPQSAHDSCGKKVVGQLFTGPADAYGRIRAPLLALTGCLCVAVLVALLVELRCSHHAAAVRAFLTRNDGFAADHPAKADKVLREAPKPSGGVFSLVFRVAAVGLALSLLVQLFVHTYVVTVTVVDTPPVDSGQTADAAVIHYGSHTARLLLIGGSSGNGTACPPVSLTSSQAWVTQSEEAVVLSPDSTVPGFRLPPSVQGSGLTACLLTAACRSCRATVPATLAFTLPWTYQSVALSLSGRDAYPGCSPAFQRMVSAPSADRLLSTVALDVEVRPVSLTYAGSLSASLPREASGHDFVYAAAAVEYRADPTLLRPDTDTVTLAVNFAPTPYCSQITITDAVDVLTLLSGLAGLVSGLGGAFRTFSRKWDTLGKSAVKALTRRVPASSGKRGVLRLSDGARMAASPPETDTRAFEAANPLGVPPDGPPPLPTVATLTTRLSSSRLGANGVASIPGGGRADFGATALDPVRPESFASRAIGGGDPRTDREGHAARPLARRQSTRKATGDV